MALDIPYEPVPSVSVQCFNLLLQSIFLGIQFLKILKEEDYVRLVPEFFHNYMGYQEEGCVYELPWEYECADDDDSFLTLKQYHSLVSIAEWQPESRVKPIS